MDKIRTNLSDKVVLSCNLKTIDTITGNISALASCVGRLSSIESIMVTLKDVEHYVKYDGDIQVEPGSESQVLNTEGKYVGQNITVLPINYQETSNESGYTAYIGKGI